MTKDDSVENINLNTKIKIETTSNSIEEHVNDIPNNQVKSTDELDAKVKLHKKLDNMPPFKRKVFLKVMQFNVLSEVLDAVTHGKNTPKKVWKSVLGKLYAIKDINIGDEKSKIDFRDVVAVLLPLLGMLAGLFMALREAEKAESEAASPEGGDEEEMKKIEKNLAEKHAANLQKSIVMQLCEAQEKGFSTN